MDHWKGLMSTLNLGLLMAGSEIIMGDVVRHKAPRYHVSPYLLERNEKGRFETDFENLRNSPTLFNENFRMSPEAFDILYEELFPYLRRKRNSRPKDFIPVKAKLAMVLEYLASGDLGRHIASCYRVSKQHFGTILSDVCRAICTALKSQMPTLNEQTLPAVAKKYEEKWNFPNCVGAIDGKHVANKAPPKSRSIFYNYKGFHSIVLLATCDASYKFTYIDVGAYGSEGDSSIFKNSEFGSNIIRYQFPFPSDTNINGKNIPHFIVADDAFPLSKRIMKPYSHRSLTTQERIFNYRLSRARRCIENAFGILSTKWLCLRKILFCSPERAQEIGSACCFFHNFLLNKARPEYCPTTFSGHESSSGEWIRGEYESWDGQHGSTFFHGRPSEYGKYVRDLLKGYVNSNEGSVPWQNDVAFI